MVRNECPYISNPSYSCGILPRGMYILGVAVTIYPFLAWVDGHGHMFGAGKRVAVSCVALTVMPYNREWSIWYWL